MTNLQKFKHAFRKLLKEYNTEIVIKEDNGIKVSIADEHECASINVKSVKGLTEITFNDIK